MILFTPVLVVRDVHRHADGKLANSYLDGT
jgi:hypothetical protein